MRKFAVGIVLLLLITGSGHAALDISEMVSADAIGFVRVGDLPRLLTEINRTIQKEGIQELSSFAMLEEMLQQMAPIVPMLVGIGFEDFLNLFGDELTLAFYGLDNGKAILAFLTDVRRDPDQAAEVIDEIRILTESNGEQLPQPGTYRGIDYEGITNEENAICFASIENLFVLGFNGGFQRVVDRMLGDGKPIHTTDAYQSMVQDLGTEGQVWGYADLEQLAPMLMQGDEAPDPGAEAIFSALEAIGLKIDLTGYEQKLYLKVHEPDNPFIKIFYQLIFTERPPMLSSSWLTDVQGVWLGLNIGDLQQIWNTLFPLTGDEQSKEILQGIRQLSDLVGVDLRKKFLPLFSGEIGAMLSIPEGEFNPENRPLDLLKLAPIIFVGLSDVSDFTEAMSRISKSLQRTGLAHASVLGVEEKQGQDVYKLFLSIDQLVPGIALTPTATILRQRDGSGLIALSNHPGQIYRLLEADRDTPIDGRIAAYVSAGDILQFIAGQSQETVPDPIAQRLEQITPLILVLKTTPNELTLSLTSPESSWLTQLINGITAGILADQLKEEE